MTITVWNSADMLNTTLSGGDLVATATAGGRAGVRGTQSRSSGKWYLEFGALSLYAGSPAYVGVAAIGKILGDNIGGDSFVAGVQGDGYIYPSYIGPLSALTGHVVCAAYDFGNALEWIRLDGTGNWNNSGTADPATGVGGNAIQAAQTWYPICGLFGNPNTATLNASPGSFIGVAPAGFSPWDIGPTFNFGTVVG